MNREFRLKTLFLILIFSCFIKANAQNIKILPQSPPPACTKINDSLFVDMAEINVFDWVEFLRWKSLEFGFKSQEFKNLIPFDSCGSYHYLGPNWGFNKDRLNKNSSFFVFINKPITGISYKQAKEYSKWRTDIVFGDFLLRNGILDSIDTEGFTVENFFNNPKYRRYHHLAYYEFDLIPIANLPQIKHLSDSLAAKKNRCRTRDLFYRFGLEQAYCINSIYKDSLVYYNLNEIKEIPKSYYDFFADVDCFTCKNDLIYHLEGNAHELTNDSTKVIANGKSNLNEPIILSEMTDDKRCFMGFRNICRLKKFNFEEK